VRKEFGVRYRAMTDGFLTFPLKFPGTAVWRAMKGRHYVIDVLTGAAARSKAAMRGGKEPDCLLDFWAQQIVKECDVSACFGGRGAVRGGRGPAALADSRTRGRLRRGRRSVARLPLITASRFSPATQPHQPIDPPPGGGRVGAAAAQVLQRHRDGLHGHGLPLRQPGGSFTPARPPWAPGTTPAAARAPQRSLACAAGGSRFDLLSPVAEPPPPGRVHRQPVLDADADGGAPRRAGARAAGAGEGGAPPPGASCCRAEAAADAARAAAAAAGCLEQ
jgi:hypothetical protein